MVPEFITDTTRIWNSLQTGYSTVSQRILPPWDLLAEFVMTANNPLISHRALCAAAIFGEGMASMPAPFSLRITWDAQPMFFRCVPKSPDRRDRALTYMLTEQITDDTVMKMRKRINSTRTGGSLPHTIPQFELLYALLCAEVKLAPEGSEVYRAVRAVGYTMGAVSRFTICPVSP